MTTADATTAAAQAVPQARVVLRSVAEAQELIKDLKRCLRESRRTGGRYTAGVTDTGGQVHITIWVPFSRK